MTKSLKYMLLLLSQIDLPSYILVKFYYLVLSLNFLLYIFSTKKKYFLQLVITISVESTSICHLQYLTSCYKMKYNLNLCAYNNIQSSSSYQCIPLIENYGQGLGREGQRQLIPIKENAAKRVS